MDLTIICISHDLKILKQFADDLIIMFDGKIVESGSSESLISNPQNEYIKFLLSAQELNLTKEEIKTFHNNYEQN